MSPAASSGRTWRQRVATMALLAPAGALFSLMVLYPLAASVALSFYQWDGVGPRIWVGLGNYEELFADPVFRTAIANNIRWLGGYLIAPVAGLALAIFLQQTLSGMRVVRSLFFMPFVISQVVVGLVFGWFFNARFGLFDTLLEAVGLAPLAPLDSERWSLWAMVAAGLWPQTAYCMILFMTGLATLPSDLIDAARVDGARGFALFRHVVFPHLRPVNFIVAMVCAATALRSFDYVMIMTLGGPYNSSTVLAYYMYEQTFLSLRYGYGAAVASVLLALMTGIIVLLLWQLFRREAD
ncbi:MAG TPA: sugar ABC transporter permease [Casimicrobiaceae bacterium]|nr:sugar ABC transporter permease [Casimicrobiaceae bacterium]